MLFVLNNEIILFQEQTFTRMYQTTKKQKKSNYFVKRSKLNTVRT
jgi:hypothetical protein